MIRRVYTGPAGLRITLLVTDEGHTFLSSTPVEGFNGADILGSIRHGEAEVQNRMDRVAPGAAPTMTEDMI